MEVKITFIFLTWFHFFRRVSFNYYLISELWILNGKNNYYFSYIFWLDCKILAWQECVKLLKDV